MAARSRALHDAALKRLADGRWSHDATAGQVYGSHGQRIGYVCATGYVRLTLSVGGRHRYVMAHCLLWEAEHGPIPDGMEVNHRNGVKVDNRAANLELVTPSGNQQHAVDTGLRVAHSGERAARVTLTDAQVIELRRRASTGERRVELAQAYGISVVQVGRIATGKQRRSPAPLAS